MKRSLVFCLSFLFSSASLLVYALDCEVTPYRYGPKKFSTLTHQKIKLADEGSTGIVLQASESTVNQIQKFNFIIYRGWKNYGGNLHSLYELARLSFSGVSGFATSLEIENTKQGSHRIRIKCGAESNIVSPSERQYTCSFVYFRNNPRLFKFDTSLHKTHRETLQHPVYPSPNWDPKVSLTSILLGGKPHLFLRLDAQKDLSFLKVKLGWIQQEGKNSFFSRLDTPSFWISFGLTSYFSRVSGS